MFRSLFLVSLLSLVFTVSSLRYTGQISTSNDFTYIGKFAFGTSGGNISAFTQTLDPSNNQINQNLIIPGQNFALFPDVAGQWDTIEDSDLTCAEKVQLAGRNVYPIGYTNQPRNPVTNNSTNLLKLGVTGRRPHFWYVVLVNCLPDSAINQTSIDQLTGLPIVVSVSYEFHLTNGGGEFTNELSWEQQHISEIAITFLIVYIVCFFALMTSIIRSALTIKESKNQLMFVLLAIVVFCQMLHQILTLSYQMEMIKNQTIKQSINQASWWFDTFSQLGLLLSVMMLCTNNQSTNQPMTRSNKLVISVMMCLYLFGYIASFAVNGRFERDYPSLTEWMFNNWGGYVLCALRLINIGVIANFFVQSINQSIEHSTGQSTRSLLAYALFATTWLTSFPLITLIASMTSSYWRAKFFYGVDSLVCFIIIAGQMTITYRNQSILKSSQFKTMEEPSKMENGEVSMSEMNRSPNNSNPSSPRSPQSPSQGFRSVAPV